MKIWVSLLFGVFLSIISHSTALAFFWGGGDQYAPKAANAIAEQIDEQLMARGGLQDGALPKKQLAARRKLIRSRITIMGTTPVNLNNLNLSNALARQMTEEVLRWLTNAGYQVKEIRKGKELRFQEEVGEMLLTRKKSDLQYQKVTSTAVLTGTYVISPEQVRFTMRLLHTPTNNVLGMGTATVPITPDVPPLLKENVPMAKIKPSVGTRLQ